MTENAHDKFFKMVMTNRENAIDFLNNYMPPEIIKEIDMDSISITKDTFIDKNLKELYSDVLYEAIINGKKGYLYILFEHKSKADKYTALQLLKYITNIWDRHLSIHGRKGKLPVILPIVVYHGKAKWRFGNQLKRILKETGSLNNYQPNFIYELYDLSRYTDKEIKGSSELWVLLYLLKNIFSSNIEEKLYYAFETLNKIENEEIAVRCINLVIQYITMATDKITVDSLEKIVETTKIIGVKNTMPTIAETWEMQGFIKGEKIGIEKGIEQGFEKGIEKGKKIAERKKALRTAINMKKKGCDLDFISEVVDLEKKKLERFFKKIHI